MSRAGQLKPNELMVNITENKSLKEANRMQCFMLTSLFSDSRDVVSIVPVCNADEC